MLTKIFLKGLPLRQVLIPWPWAEKLAGPTRKMRKAVASDQSDSTKLILYARPNISPCNYEAGIIYCPGDHCRLAEAFPWKMLRVFGKDEKLCFSTVVEHYFTIVKTNNLAWYQCV